MYWFEILTSIIMLIVGSCFFYLFLHNHIKHYLAIVAVAVFIVILNITNIVSHDLIRRTYANLNIENWARVCIAVLFSIVVIFIFFYPEFKKK